MNLAGEEFVPYRTIIKTRCGARAMYLKDISAGVFTRRFLLLDPAKDTRESQHSHFMLSDKGEYEIDEEHPLDAVSIGRKWEPSVGEMVRVVGYSENLSNNEASDLTENEALIVVLCDELFIKVQDTETSIRYIVNKAQCRRVAQ